MVQGIIIFILGILSLILFVDKECKRSKLMELEGLVKARNKSLGRAEKTIERQIIEIKARNIVIKNQQEEISNQTDKIIDLNNNIEYLFNNLSKQKRELVRPSNQN